MSATALGCNTNRIYVVTRLATRAVHFSVSDNRLSLLRSVVAVADSEVRTEPFPVAQGP